MDEFFDLNDLHQQRMTRVRAGSPIVATDTSLLDDYLVEHREFLKASPRPITFFSQNAERKIWERYLGPDLHCEDGPAVVAVYPELKPGVLPIDFGTTAVRYEAHYRHGIFGRPPEEGPSFRVTTLGGETLLEIYQLDEVLHRDPQQGPARYLKDALGEEWEYCWHGKRNRIDGPAYVFTYADGRRVDGRRVDGEEYFRNGKWHRLSSEGPAIHQVTPNGLILFEIYVEDGEITRNPAAGPAWYSFENGVVRSEYRVRGKLHRSSSEGPAYHHKGPDGERIAYYSDGEYDRPFEDGPAVIERDAQGNLIAEYYYQRGVLNRPVEDGPAETWQYADRPDQIMQGYRQNDQLHRVDGPAYTTRHRSTGAILMEEYWEEGDLVLKPRPWRIERDTDGHVTSKCWKEIGSPDLSTTVCYDEHGRPNKTKYWAAGRQVGLQEFITLKERHPFR